MTDPCGCIYDGDYDPPEVYFSRVQKARKEHECEECSRTIQIGERYETVFGRAQGYIYTPKTCLSCVSIREAFFCEGFQHGSMMEKVHDHIQEMNGRIGFDCLEKLSDLARENPGDHGGGHGGT